MYQTKRQESTLRVATFNITSLTDRCRRWLVPGIFLLVDYGAVSLAVWTTYIIYMHMLPPLVSVQQFNHVNEIYSYAYIAVPVIVVFFMSFANMYTRRMPIWQQTEKIFKVTVYSSLFILATLYFIEPAIHISRTFMVMLGFFIFAYLSLNRYFIKKFLVAIDLWQIPVILIGAGKTAEILLKSFEQSNGISYKVVGIIEDNKDNIDELFSKIPIIGSFVNAEEAVQRTGIKNVLLAAPGLDRKSLVDMIYRLQPHARNITFVPDILGVPVGAMEMETLLDERMVLLKVRNNLSLLRNKIFKLVFDRVLGMIIFLLSLPIMGLIALLIKLESAGDILYIGKRLGKNGKVFSCYKFCTMYKNNAEILEDYLENNPVAKLEWDEYAKLKSYDPRVTRIGKWLRKFSLDELPQIFNVIKGEMSLVGPRPYLPTEKKRMNFYEKTISMVTPGVSGLWQVSGRNEMNFEGRLELDCWYIRNWSLWLDVIILLKTIRVVFTGKGSY